MPGMEPPLHLRDDVSPWVKEFVEVLEHDRIADAARAYLEARRKNEAAEPVDWERARAEVDRTYHDLLVACGYEDQE